MNKLKVKVTTLGCKANQCDSFFIQNYLNNSNCEVILDKSRADICIINTCTVTGKSDFQSRQEIRRAIRNNAGAKVYVTGCYARTGTEEIKSIKGVTDVIVPEEIKNFLEKLKNDSVEKDYRGSNTYVIPFVENFPGRTRAFFKIQDGCNFKCSYCIVPFARGRSRSLPLQDVISGLKRYVELGYKEVVLTGVHLGSYGQDLTPKRTLDDLLEEILNEVSGIRVRLSSLDPHEISNRIIALVSSSSLFCRHFHIPLQSGDNKILKLMHRNYSAEKFKEVVLRIKEAIPDAGVGIDVIAGFPGESDKEFRNTYSLIESLPISYLHVFPFSIRRGTEAEKLPEKVHGSVIKERAKILIELGEEKKRNFYTGFIGKTVAVLIEDKKKNHYYRGFTDHYVPVLIKGGHVKQGELINVKIEVLRDLELIASRSEKNG